LFSISSSSSSSMKGVSLAHGISFCSSLISVNHDFNV
jgi:hypothetical protein